MYELVCPQAKPICKARFCRRVLPQPALVTCSRTCAFEERLRRPMGTEESRRRNRTMLGLRDGTPDALSPDRHRRSCALLVAMQQFARGLHASAAPTETACDWVTRTTGSSTQRSGAPEDRIDLTCANGLASAKRFGAQLRTGQVSNLGDPFRIGSSAFLRLLNGARISDEKWQPGAESNHRQADFQ